MKLSRAIPFFLSALAAAYTAGVAAGPGEGQGIYESFCVVCHGGLGGGETMGKPLVDNSARNLGDSELIAVITSGRPGTGMAAYGGALSETEIRDVAGYIRVLQGGTGLSDGEEDAAANANPLVARGEQVFLEEASCNTCHSYRGSGGTIGPSLDGIAARLDEKALRKALEAPSADIAEGYGVKVLNTNDGKTIRGRYRNDTEQAIQILSEDGTRWVTQFKRNLSSVEDGKESLMPETFKSLSKQDQDALLAFLKTL